MTTESRVGVSDQMLIKKKGQLQMPLEDNMLLASWLDAKTCHSYENTSDEKLLFFLNETLLEKKSIIAHFQHQEHKKMFQEKHIEFMCRKGR